MTEGDRGQEQALEVVGGGRLDLVWAADFLRHFALPLCRGGKVHVGTPLGLAGLTRLREAVAAGLDHTAPGQQLTQARRDLCDEIVLAGPQPLLQDDPQALYLLCGLHDLLFLLHPTVDNLVGAGRRLRRLAAHVLVLLRAAAAPDLPDPVLLAERHSLLHGLWGMQRYDVRISFWAGRREFHGQEAPMRLRAWRTIRRVHEERWQAPVHQHILALAQPEGLGPLAFDALLRTSPLTDLLHPLRQVPAPSAPHSLPDIPPLQLGRHAVLLSDPILCRAVLSRYLDQGLHTVGGALGRSAMALLGEDAPAGPGLRAALSAGPGLRAVLCLLSHLQLCTLISAEPVALPPLAQDPGLRDLYGLYGALHERHRALAVPADAPVDLRERARVHALAAAQAVGPVRLAQIAAVLEQKLAPERGPSPLQQSILSSVPEMT